MASQGLGMQVSRSVVPAAWPSSSKDACHRRSAANAFLQAEQWSYAFAYRPDERPKKHLETCDCIVALVNEFEQNMSGSSSDCDPLFFPDWTLKMKTATDLARHSTQTLHPTEGSHARCWGLTCLVSGLGKYKSFSRLRKDCPF